MAANKIYIQVDFQSQSATTAVDELNKNIKNIGTTSEQSTKQAASGMKGFSVQMESAADSAQQLTRALAGLGVARIAQQLLGMGEEMDRLFRSFQGMVGGAALIEDLKQVADRTGTLRQTVFEAAAVMRNAQIPAKDLARDLEIMANQIAAAGKAPELLAPLATAITKIQVATQPTARQLQAIFLESGFPVVAKVAQELSKSLLELKDNMRTVDPTQLTKLVLALMAQENVGRAAALATTTLTGEYNLLKNAVTDLGVAFERALGPSLIKIIEFLRTLLGFLTDLLNMFAKLPQPLKDATVGFFALAGAITAVATAIGALNLAVNAGLFGWLGKLVTGFGAVAEAGAGVTGIFVEIGTAMGPVGAVVSALVLALGALWVILNTKPKTTVKDAVGAPTQKEIDDLKAHLFVVDPEKVKHEIEASQNILDAARARNLKAGKDAIEALGATYNEYFRKAAGIEVALAKIREALALEVDAEIKKRHEESNKATDKNIEETSRLRRQTLIAAVEAVPDETFAGRQNVAAVRAYAYEQQLQDDQAFQNKRIEQQLATDVKGAQAQLKTAGKSQEFINAEVLKLKAFALQQEISLHEKTDEAIRKHRLESEKITNELIFEQHKQLQQEILQDNIAAIQRSASLQTAYLGARQAQTFEERVAQIGAISNVEVQAIAKTRDAQIAANDEALQYYRDTHAANVEGIAELEDKMRRENVRLERDADTQIQLNRYNAWKETNAAIIEDQKQAYEAFKNAASQVFDALFDKSKSVLAAIGNVIKSAVVNFAKEIVTSRVAAGLSGLFGYGTPTFKSNFPLRQDVIFSGAGAPPVPREFEAFSTRINYASANLNIVAGNLNTAAVNLNAAAGSIVVAARSFAGGTAAVATTGEASREMIDQAGSAVSATGMGMQTVPAALPFPTGGGTYTPPAFGIPALAGMGGLAPMGVGLPGFAPGMQGSLGLGGAGSMTPSQTLTNILGSFGIGKNVATGAGSSVSWSAATATQKLGAILKSPGMGQLALGLGAMTALSGFQRGGTSGQVQGIAGSTLAGLGLAQAFPALGLTPVGGAALGLGLGVAAAGLQRGGILGLGMSVGGGALAGAMIGGMFGGPGGMLVGAAIGAAVGGIAGLIRLFNPSLDQRIRSEVKRVYGVDISQKSIRDTIAQIVTSKYGGNLSIALYSQDVQDIVRLYALNVGQSQAGLPRPMYGASFAQSQVGGLQMQPVYSGGQLVQNPYQGTTTTQLQNALIQSNTPAIFLQMSPQQANALFAGQVVNVLNNNPGAVAQANTTAAVSGSSRASQVSALIEPLAVTR